MILLYIYGFHCLLGLLTYLRYKDGIEHNVDQLYPIEKKQEKYYHFVVGFIITFAWFPFAVFALYSAWKVKDKK